MTLHQTGAIDVSGAPRLSGTRQSTEQRLRLRLRAVVLLGGSVRPTRLSAAIGRSVLDLPVEEQRSVLDCWRDQTAELARALERDDLPVRVMLDATSPAPTLRGEGAPVRMVAEHDPAEYRGTAGVLRDVASHYAGDDLILVANAAQLLLESLPALALRLAARGADVAILAHRGDIPSGLKLIRCATLDLVPDRGFVDLKEQALPRIAAAHQVVVVEQEQPAGLPLRTLGDYLGALREHHRRQAMRETGATGSLPASVFCTSGREGTGGQAASGTREAADAFIEDWRPTFTLVEQGALVHPQARVHDSVVLRGGRVGAGAAVVRSIVCPGGVVRREAMAVDQLIAPRGVFFERGS